MANADLELFKQLNAEYESKPLVAKARGLESASLTDQAETRAAMLERRIGIRGKRVLDIGCGRGQLANVLTEQYDCEYVGVDITSYPSWPEVQAKGADLRVHDITLLDNDELGTFERIISFAVFEHVERPYEGIEAIGSLLGPDGLAYMSANLYRGPKASHRYREVYFPFPHLLFDDEVFLDFYREFGGKSRPAWVNKLTAAQYREKVRDVGLSIVEEWASTTPLDEEFYERFVDVLGKYPKVDLETDFIHLILRSSITTESSATTQQPGEPQTITQLLEEVRSLKARIKQIEESTSWKLTKPVRKFGDQSPAVRKLIRRGLRR